MWFLLNYDNSTALFGTVYGCTFALFNCNIKCNSFAGCVAVPFGSITTGLGVKSSDADCFIRLPPGWRTPHGNHVHKAKRILQQYPKIFAEIFAIPRANTPIVKFFHVPTQTNCDVTFKTPLGAQNSKLISFLLQADPRLIPMAVVVKYWAKVHGFSGTGKLTNYALTLLIIFYLQQAPVSILPSVEWLQRDAATAVIVDEWNTGFMDDYNLIPQSTNTSSISELLGGFFQYYSTFNFAEMIVCPFLGVPVKKELFKDLNLLPNEFDRYIQNVRNRVVSPMRFTTSICVQDPFELCHNVASAITSRLTVEIIAFFKFAATAYDTEKLNNCKNLLQTILLQKPKIPREKFHLEFRAVIFSHLIKEIENPDWKSVVRDVTIKVFEQMCKIKLVKIEEKPNESAKKQRDKFTGVITKAIWKRKQFSKLYSLMKLDFVQKQTRITEEILNVEKQTFNIQFRLTLTFKQETKQTTATIKLMEGDVVIFKEFGKFFMSIVHNWYTVLLKDSLRPREQQRHSQTSSNVVNNETKPEDDNDLRMSVSQTEESDTSDVVNAEAASNIDQQTP
ncbi:unnamed protein product [Euphydryas editha]|uniref:Speckle targeted PIP5K1A-regulated poly(A) polymerase n=1 Tax=Euphydryas editha TaxID=104508 RepID=A0AAU9TXK2_EUPED|nr:unnamed protein product [Euphydryas editha]